jgi:hypothetical protein
VINKKNLKVQSFGTAVRLRCSYQTDESDPVHEILRNRPLKQVKLKSEQEPMLEGELFAEIKQEDSTWTIRE